MTPECRRPADKDQPVGALPTPALNPFDNIALAHLEVYTLYELAQALARV